MFFSATMGRLGATVAGTTPCSTGGHPKTFKGMKRRLQMNKFRFTLNALAIAIFTLAFASMAQAQATRTWVSGVGDDANPCSRTAPCKTWAGAISKTANGGEIDALDPGGFGGLTITKSITLDGGGGQVASTLVAGVNGIVVSATTSDVVIIRNVRFDGLLGNGSNSANAGTNGIRFLAGKALNVENCYIFGFNTNGIDVELNQATNATVFVKDTVVKNCAGDGIFLTNAQSGQLRAALERSSFVENGNGIHAKNGTFVVASAMNCDFSLNSGKGVWADAVAGTAVDVIRAQHCQISGNGGNGVQAGNGGNTGISLVGIDFCQIDFNAGNGALISSGAGGTTIETFTNNSIRGNGTNGCPGCTGVGPGN
jgi:hypothetical protein